MSGALQALISTAGEAPVAENLSFDLPPSSTAIIERKQFVRAYPSSASTLTPTGTRVVRIRLGGQGFVPPESVRLVYTIMETGAASPLTPLTGPWGIWSQARLLAGNGVEIDNIQQYGRHHTYFGWWLTTLEQQFAESVYGWGGSFSPSAAVSNNHAQQGTITASTSLTVSHKLCLSMFQQSKMIALNYCNMDLELTLNSDVTSWLSTGSGKSSSFSIQNIQLVYDLCELDPALTDSMYRSLLANRVLNYPLTYYAQQTQVIPAGTSYTFTAQRVFSRLAMVWLNFRAAGATAASFVAPTTPDGSALTGAAPVFAGGTAPSARLSIAGVYWPNPQPATTWGEHFWQLQKALPVTPNINRNDFLNNCFGIVWDLRRVPGDPASAVSTRSGDQLTVQLDKLTSGVATEVTLTMFAFDVLAVRESGPVLLF